MKKALLILIALLCISAQGMCISVSYVECTWDGTKVVKTNKSESGCSPIPNELGIATIENSGWYFVDGVQTITVVYIKGAITVNLILPNGSKLKAPIHFLNNSAVLNIYAQEGGTGEIDADASSMSDLDCAGIGGTERDGHYHCGTINIHGGKITAKGAEYGAGIGGGDGGNGGYVTIFDGIVNAYGGVDAAGIGGGEGGNGGTLTVYGGTVFADGTDWGAGIGGGEDGTGATVKILGGSVTAWAGGKAGPDGGCAIGSGGSGNSRGSLTIGDQMMVHAGDNASDAASHIFPVATRVPACFYRTYAVIEPCNHEGKAYTVDGTDAEGTHSLKCLHCKGVPAEKHTFDGGKCTVCGVDANTYTVKIYLPAKDGSTFTKKYNTKPEERDVAYSASIHLPMPPEDYIPEDATFAGWVIGSDPTADESIYKAEGDVLKNVGDPYTVTGPISIKARFTDNNIVIGEETNNSEILYLNDGKTAPRVTLTGRTLYKDGNWNTICLPFDVTIAGSPLDGAGVDVRTLSSSSWEGGVLKLTFTPKGSVTTMEAGKPYLIKWTPGDNLTGDLTFTNKLIKGTPNHVSTDYVTFVGTYSPNVIYNSGTYQTELYMESNNTLKYSKTEGFKVNSCRGYFRLENLLYADEKGIHHFGDIIGGGAREIVLDFGDDDNTTGIIEAGANSQLSTWYTLDGRRLQGKPTTKGVYINNGKKVIIK